MLFTVWHLYDLSPVEVDSALDEQLLYEYTVHGLQSAIGFDPQTILHLHQILDLFHWRVVCISHWPKYKTRPSSQ